MHIKNLGEKLKLKEKFGTELQQKTREFTYFKDYGRLQIQFCVSLHKLFSNTYNP